MRNRVWRLSVPSSTISAPARIFSAFETLRSLVWVSISTEALIRCRSSAAASAFGRFRSSSVYRICRCRLCSSTISRSTSTTWPIPARTRAFATALPRAPRPTITARLSLSFCCPPVPISGRRTWRQYRSLAVLRESAGAPTVFLSGSVNPSSPAFHDFGRVPGSCPRILR